MADRSNGNTLTPEQVEAIKLDDEAKEKSDADGEKKDPGKESQDGLEKQVTSLQKQMKDIQASETRLYQEHQTLKTTVDERDARIKELEIEVAEVDDKGDKGKPNAEPDITQDIDGWMKWYKEGVLKDVSSLVDERVGEITNGRDKEDQAATDKDDKIDDYADYIRAYHPDLVDKVSKEGVPSDLQGEMTHWERMASQEGVKSIVKARRLYEAENPDEAAQEAAVLKRLREKRETLTREGKSAISEPPLEGKALSGTSWNEVAERAAKELEAMGGLDDLEL